MGTKMSPSETYSKLLGNFEKEIVGAAEAMPEDKFNFAPTQGEYKGVRTFAEQVKHIAESNYYFLGGFAGTERKVAPHREAHQQGRYREGAQGLIRDGP